MESSPLKGLTIAGHPFSGFPAVSPDFQSRAAQRCNAAIEDNPTIATSHRLVLTQKSHIALMGVADSGYELGVG